MPRSPDFRRSLLFVAGADAAAHERALAARPDILTPDLEDLTPPALKDSARAACAALFGRMRAAGIIPSVRINPLDDLGRVDLSVVIPAGAALISLPKAESGRQIAALAAEIERLETAHGLPLGGVEIMPTAETARGVVNVREMAEASPRVKSAILGAEDLAADLMAVRSPQGDELAYARARFVLECRACGIEPIDAPYTFSDVEGCERETRRSRQLGYRSKSTVTAAHVATIHAALTPDAAEIANARAVVEGFEAARARGEDRALVNGLWIEPPTYLNARRLLERGQALIEISGLSGAAVAQVRR